MENQKLLDIYNELKLPFYNNWEFWIFIVLGLLSIVISIITFREAKKAKEFAHEAGKIVKIHNITIELSEIINKLQNISSGISFSEARSLYNEVNIKIKRYTVSFKLESEYKTNIELINDLLKKISEILDEVKPNENQNENVVKDSIYNAIESHFSHLSGLLAELMGNFENKTSI